MRILLDVDGVIADCVDSICTALSDLGYPRTEADITTYNFADCLTAKETAMVLAKMSSVGFCRGMRSYPGITPFLARLQSLGEVVAVTKPYANSPTWVWERDIWLASEARGVKVIHTAHKELISGDVLIEDCVDNVRTWLASHPESYAVLLDRPWNRDVTLYRMRRAFSYDEVVDLVMRGGVKGLYDSKRDT